MTETEFKWVRLLGGSAAHIYEHGVTACGIDASYRYKFFYISEEQLKEMWRCTFCLEEKGLDPETFARSQA